MQYCAAIAVLEKKASIPQFTNEKVNSPAAREMIKKIQVVVDPEMKVQIGATVTITLKNGKKYSQRVEVARGAPSLPLSKEDLIAKYVDCAGLVLAKKDIDRSLEIVDRLEKVDDVRALAECALNAK